MDEITARIREEARRLFKEGMVDVVIGYQEAWDEDEVTPCFLTDESQVEWLIFNENCHHNLAKYLVGREGYLTSHFRAPEERQRVAIVARPATLRTIVGLIQEYQFTRDALVVLGILDGTSVGIEPDVVVGHIEEDCERQQQVLGEIGRLESMSPSERWDWWEQQFAKCIRCYACRQVCPFCYCEQCVADENQPQWIERSPSVENNRTWNIVRAFHLVGRCVECGECDRACPVNIPLSVIAAKMGSEVERAFGYVAGANADAKPALRTFRPDDPEEFIR